MSPAQRQLKSIFGFGIKKAGFLPSENLADMVTFKLDPNRPNFILDTEPYQRNF